MYRVIKTFRDKDTRILYQAGDVFPRPGTEVSVDRLNELATVQNRRSEPMIKPVVETAVNKSKTRQTRKKAAKNKSDE